MTIPEYLKNLERLKQLAISRWGSLTSIERNVVDGSFEWLIDNLDIKKGEIVVDEDLSRVMDEFLSAVLDTVNNVPLYQSKLKQFLQDLTTIQTNNKLFHRTTNRFNIETSGVTGVQKAVVGQIIDQYTSNGLNAHFAAPLKENIFRNILAGANMREVKKVLQSYILSGEDKSGKLGSYIDQTAQQAVDSYTGAINQQLVAEFDFTGYIISGSLIETSSEQCVFAVEEANKGYLSFKDWEEVLEIARNNEKAKLIPGTTIKNLPLNKLHWGCRHNFTPVIIAEPKEKPVKVEKKKEPEADPLTATTIKSGREISKKLFKDNAGLTIGSVTVSADLKVETLNRFNKVLNDLTKEYNISPLFDKSEPVQIQFRSTPTKYGWIQTNNVARNLVEMNFGHLTDNNRAVVVDPLISFQREKSMVDKDNVEVATVVHEFAHVISTQRGQLWLSQIEDVADFWPTVDFWHQEYKNELKEIMQKNNHDQEFSEVFLGKYAATSQSEFMAEAFTEYKLRTNPSKYAKKIGLLIDKHFKK